jgi:hypothetical protein
MKRCLLVALPVVPLLGSDSPEEYDDRTERVGIEGTRRWTEIEYKGAKATAGKEESVRTFHGGIYTFQWGKEMIRGTYHTELDCKSPPVDYTPSNLKTPRDFKFFRFSPRQGAETLLG